MYYDGIASQWNRITGYQGGAFKRYVLNERLLGKIDGIAGKTILELGAGNGYFALLMLRRFSGQTPARLLITDQSQKLLVIAEADHRANYAEYLALDVQESFPLDDGACDLILASMLLNELTTTGLRNALRECARAAAGWATARGGPASGVHPHAGEKGRAHRLRTRSLCHAQRRGATPACLAPPSADIS